MGGSQYKAGVQLGTTSMVRDRTKSINFYESNQTRPRMGIVVRKSPLVVVKPSAAPAATGDIKLSPYDMPFLMMPSAATFLVFDHPIHEPIMSIKRGLSKALVHYHAFAGRLGKEPVAHIRCAAKEAGVHFLGASADCALKDIKSFDQPLLEDLAMYYPGEACSLIDPLLMMQVTEFSCGGFIVGVIMNHAVADGHGLGQFLCAIGELVRGMSPSGIPVRWDASLMGSSPPGLFYMDVQPSEMALQDITISSSLISMIKDKFSARSLGRRSCTVYEAVVAVLWQCRTRAIISDPEAPTAILFLANAREYAGAKDGYYGNCVTGHPVMAASGAVASGDLMSLVEMIQSAKDQLSKERDSRRFKEPAVPPEEYNAFAVTSARNLGFEQADLGGGRPARVVMRYKRDRRVCVPSCFLIPARREMVGAAEILSLSVKEQHAEAFIRELVRLEPAMAKL